jgi:MSHA biogenesis protein MshL
MTSRSLKTGLAVTAALSLVACAASPPAKLPVSEAIHHALQSPAPATVDLPEPSPMAAPMLPDSVNESGPKEPRISIAMNNVPARQFFMALTAGTRYTMLIHTNVSGILSAKLHNVTVQEALDAMRDLYDFDIAMHGYRITVRQPMMETRIFQVNYPTGSRKGHSETRVSAGSLADTPVNPSLSAQPVPVGGRSPDSSRVSTFSEADFWTELKSALEAIAGISQGSSKSIVVSPQSGVIVVRAMPRELRDIASYLRATQLSVERQVILEAKIIEVQLSSGFQSGVNWSAFGSGSTRIAGGVLQPGASLSNTPNSTLTSNNLAALTGTAGSAITAASNNGGTLFGLALQGTSFAALVSFLETQGTVQVLSSPRVSTLNNQQAVLKVGTDEFFVTGVTGGSTTPSSGGAITTPPNVTLRPFFSGVVLDVLPQIDADGNIILHIRPSVSQVSTVTKNINLGSGGQLQLPLASSSASEADSVVRAKNGQVVVIGGLMRESGINDRSYVPGIGEAPVVGRLFGNRSRSSQKRELVILLKPTIISDESQWSVELQSAKQRLHQLGKIGPE